MLTNLIKRQTLYALHGLGQGAQTLKVVKATQNKETNTTHISPQQMLPTTLRGDTLPRKSMKS